MSKPTRFEFDARPRPAVRARLKPLHVQGTGELLGYRVLCGRAACPGDLGFLVAPAFASTGEWELDHPSGYGGYQDSGYFVLADADRRRAKREWFAPGARGRRFDPARLESWARGKYASLAPDSVIGERPRLPCLIICRRCGGTPNDVALPV